MSGPAVSWLTVAYHSSALLPAALSSLRREAERSGLTIESVVVDHSESAAEHRRLETLGIDRLIAGANRGYAAGLNAGASAASGSILLAGNPDVVWRPGSLAALLRGLDRFEVVGPQFQLGEFLFPPADEQTLLAEWRRVRAARSERARRAHLSRELARWRRVWNAAGPIEVPALSGALLALRRPLWDRVGPWDEEYFLFFEETEWLRRARRRGARLAVVPDARVLHRWGHAADARDPHTQQRFAESRRRYYRRHYGRLGSWITAPRPASPPAPAPPLPAAERLGAQPALWLASPSPLGLPAAGAVVAGSQLAGALQELADQAPALAELTVTPCDARGAPQAGYAWAARRRGGAGDWTVRPSAATDEPALGRLFERSFGHAPEDGYWRWKYAQFPGRSRSLVAVRDGEILAHAGALAQRARIAGAPADIWTLVDFMGTTAGAGLRPPLVEVGRALLGDLPGPDDAPWIFGFPSRRHFRLGERSFGYQPLLEIPTWSGELPTAPGGADWLRTVDDRGPADSEEIWSAAGVDGVVRSRGFLDWRYWARPGRYYRCYSFGRRAVSGFAVFAFQPGQALAAELWMAPGCDARAVLLEIAADLRASGIERWSFWETDGVIEGRLREDLALRPGEPVFVGIRPRSDEAATVDPSSLARRFSYRMGDYDLV